MRHNKKYAKLGRESSHRRAMLRNMATSLLIHGSIETSLEKAKAVRPIVEKIITRGKRGDIHSRRIVASYLFDKLAVNEVFSKYAKGFADRAGGYTRILKLGTRIGDGMKKCRLQLMGYEKVKALPTKADS